MNFKSLSRVYKYHTFLSQEERELLQEIFGSMEPISPAEFYKIYVETGVDVDGRISEMTQLMPFARRQMQCMIGFVKALPGFRELLEKDKIALLKGIRLSF